MFATLSENMPSQWPKNLTIFLKEFPKLYFNFVIYMKDGYFLYWYKKVSYISYTTSKYKQKIEVFLSKCFES